MKIKTCKECGQPKPITEYYVNKHGWVYAKCKTCKLESDKRRGLVVDRDQKHKNATQQRRWRRTNPEAEKGYDANKRARRAGVPGILTKIDVERVWEKWGGMCWVCGIRADQLDHFRPINKDAGGTNEPNNIRPICSSCKHKRSYTWFGAEKAELEAKMIKEIQVMVRGSGIPYAPNSCSQSKSTTKGKTQ